MPKIRLSFAHEHPELRAQNPLYARTQATSPTFNESAHDARADRKAAYVANRKPQTMVERSRPQPTLKPSPQLAADVDRAAYTSLLREERKAAWKEVRRQEILSELIERRSALEVHAKLTDTLAREVHALSHTSPNANQRLRSLGAQVTQTTATGGAEIQRSQSASARSRSFNRQR